MTKFSSSLPILIYDRPQGSSDLWQDFDRGPGIFFPRPGYELNIRIRNIDNHTLKDLVAELVDLPELAFLDLSENRKITDFTPKSPILLSASPLHANVRPEGSHVQNP